MSVARRDAHFYLTFWGLLLASPYIGDIQAVFVFAELLFGIGYFASLQSSWTFADVDDAVLFLM